MTNDAGWAWRRALPLIVPAIVALAIALPLAWGSDAAGLFSDGVVYLAQGVLHVGKLRDLMTAAPLVDQNRPT